ncbi:MAG TPA: serine/threonine-protein kinase [Candidatus Acidoferrales bacterium]|nr:serine/threonine-protein kinase [Candidatus Acidoferrales bacterium]
MNNADGPTKNITSADIGLPTQSLSPGLDPNTTAVPGGESRGATEKKSIGNYLLVKKLGEGGMGQVWLAEQTAPVRRQVALKLIKVGMYDDTILHRFESERQSLAIMDHPSIAKVFDAGTTSDGQPYFVMEFVQGLPITTYCDQHHLKIRDRLELFIRVCEGVQHAHQKAIIHRDLKPANILVVDVDGKPTPRIIDFGLAKALTPQGPGEMMFTQAGGFVGTPAYMSPEQAEPGGHDVDTRADVYSLGVILYELLTGSLPLDPRQWQKQPLHEVLRQLREGEAPRPSTKVETEKASSTAAAEVRGTFPRHLVNQLQGDLDWITMKAIEKEQDRRYGTPSELAADVRRYLNYEPVEARPASTAYRLKKYVRRHRVMVAVAAGVVLLLAGFTVVQAEQLRRITRERDRATRISDFMTRMFKVSDPSEARGNTVTAREILDRASAEISTGLAQDPEVQAQMMHAMGTVYDNLGLYSRAQPLEQRALDIRKSVLGTRNPDTLKSMSDLANVLANEGLYAQSEKLDRETLDLRRRALGPERLETLASMSNLARDLDFEGRYAETEKLNRETLEIRRRVLGPEHPDTLASMSNLAEALRMEGSYAEAEKLDRETLEVRRRVLGPDHPDTLASMNNLALLLDDESHYAEAEKLHRETLEIKRRVLGPEHPDTLLSMNNLARDLQSEGHYAEAEKLDRDALEIRRRTLGPEHPETLVSEGNLGDVLSAENRFAEAEALQRHALAEQTRILGQEHADRLSTMTSLANTLMQMKKYADAETLLKEAQQIQLRVLGPDSPDAAISTYNLGAVAAHRGQPDAALALLREAVDHGFPPDGDLGIDSDPDLKSLHGDPRFDALVAHAKERAAAAQKPR